MHYESAEISYDLLVCLKYYESLFSLFYFWEAVFISFTSITLAKVAASIDSNFDSKALGSRLVKIEN